MTAQKWLVWPDTHIPYHDKRKVKVMLDIVKKWQPDRITLLGDLDDMKAPSRFASGTPDEWTDRVDITTETHTKKFVVELRDTAGNETEIDYFEGNHEVRLPNYIAKNAKALHGLVTLPKILDLDNLGIKWYTYEDPAQEIYKGWYVHHGSKVSKHSSYSAQAELNSYFVNGFSGHTHRLGRYHFNSEGTGQLVWMECGHLSDVSKQKYTQVHNWQHGFAYAYVDRGKVHPQQVQFVGNTCYLDGVKFTG